jgi:hypothetical protein
MLAMLRLYVTRGELIYAPPRPARYSAALPRPVRYNGTPAARAA